MKNANWGIIKPVVWMVSVLAAEFILCFTSPSSFPFWKLFLEILGIGAPLFAAVDLLLPGHSYIKSLFSKPDPLDDLRDYVDNLKEKCVELNGNMQKLKAQTVKTKRIIKQNTKEIDRLTISVDMARKNIKPTDEALALNQIGRLDALNAKYTQMLGRMDDLYAMLHRVQEYTSYKLADAQNEVRMREQEYNAISSGYSAMMNAKDIMDSEGDEVMLSAAQKLNDDLHAKLAEMEVFMELSEPLFSDLNVQKSIDRMEGERIYERIMLEGQAFLDKVEADRK